MLIVSPHYGQVRGGAEHNDEMIGACFREKGHEVRFAYAWDAELPSVRDPNPGDIRVETDYVRTAGSTSKRWPMGPWIRHTFESRFVQGLVARAAPLLQTVDLCLLTGKPVLGRIKPWVRGLVVYAVRGAVNRLYHRRMRRIDGLIFWGGCEQDSSYTPPAHQRVLHADPGVEADLFAAAKPDRALLDRLGWQQQSLVIGVVARLEPIKQIDGVIRAAASLQRDGLPVRLLVVGGGSLERPLRDYASSHLEDRSYHFTGAVADKAAVASLVRSMRTVVLNSRSENHPIVLKEAICAGVYAVAPDVGRVRSVLCPPSFGVTFPPGDERALCSTLQRALLRRERWPLASPPWSRGSSWCDVASTILDRFG